VQTKKPDEENVGRLTKKRQLKKWQEWDTEDVDEPAITFRFRQYTAAVSATMSLVASGAVFCWPTPLLPLLLGPDSPVSMTPQEASWMVSFVEVGCLLSPLVIGFLCDYYGRKLCILIIAPVFLITTIQVVYIKTVISLSIARALQGVAMAFPYTVVPLYLGEIASKEVRGTITSFFHVAWGLGCLFPYCVGPFLSYEVYTYVTLLLTLIFFIYFIWCPDTPYYYFMKKRPLKAAKALRRLRDSVTEQKIQEELLEIQTEVQKSMTDKGTWKDVFATPADRRALLLLIIVGVVSFLSGQNAILIYATDTFTKFPTIVSPDWVTFAIGVAAILGSTLALYTSDTFGRRTLLITSSIGCMVSLLVASAYFYLHSDKKIVSPSVSWIAPLALIMYNFFVTAGMHPVCVTYTSELFPTKTRGVASSISSFNLTICSFLVLKLYETLSSMIGIYFIYLSFGITCFIGTILFYYMMPETKGKTFLEIRESLEKSSY